MENARHECTCTLEDVAKAGRDVLRFGGRLCLCQRPERLADAMNVFRSYGLEPKRLRLVQQRINTGAVSVFTGSAARRQTGAFRTADTYYRRRKRRVFRRNAGNLRELQIRSRGRTRRWKKINCFAVHCMWWARPSEICRIFRPARRETLAAVVHRSGGHARHDEAFKPLRH